MSERDSPSSAFPRAGAAQSGQEDAGRQSALDLTCPAFTRSISSHKVRKECDDDLLGETLFLYKIRSTCQNLYNQTVGVAHRTLMV